MKKGSILIHFSSLAVWQATTVPTAAFATPAIQNRKYACFSLHYICIITEQTEFRIQLTFQMLRQQIPHQNFRLASVFKPVPHHLEVLC